MALPSHDWLDDFNSAADLARDGKVHEALVILNGLAPRLVNEPALTPRFHIMFELRRADLFALSGDRTNAMQRFSAAMKIAFEQAQESEVCRVYRQLLESIRNWKDWRLLLETTKQLISLARDRGFQVAALEAGYHMPYAYRGIGDVKRAREYAAAILQRAKEVNCKAEIEHWTEFIDTVDESSAS